MGSKTDSTRKKVAPLRRLKRPDKPPMRDRGDWVRVAREALISKGIEQVRVEPLAKMLNVTAGSFYHHFRNRKELLDELLKDWERFNSSALVDAVRQAPADPDAQYWAISNAWVSEERYIPAYDAAVRAWAHTSPHVAECVRKVDDERIALVQEIFEGFGYDPLRAFIRARIMYFHQVGYQAMNVVESGERRRELMIYYREALVGVPPTSPA
jgi:AcrR family transcriptional regulator